MACTYAVRYSDEGKRTLIVTTDPASNLADVFEQTIGHQITSIVNVPNLSAMEIDPDTATWEYIDHAITPIRKVFPAQIVQVMEEQMSGPCTAEVVCLCNRFTDFLDVPSNNGIIFDIVILNTAPTGHTIRLLELPAEWVNRLTRPVWLKTVRLVLVQQRRFKTPSINTSAPFMQCGNPAQTSFVFVLILESISIKETHRAI